MLGLNISDKICIALEGLIIVLAIALAGYCAWETHTARVQVTLLTSQNRQLQQDNATLKANQLTLQTSLDTQNTQIQQLSAEKSAAEFAADAAQQAIAAAQLKRSGALKKLQTEKAQSCTQAMPLVRQALGAMQ
jgi:chromosome segregation ATPase